MNEIEDATPLLTESQVEEWRQELCQLEEDNASMRARIALLKKKVEAANILINAKAKEESEK
jgi:hypothetical protein